MSATGTWVVTISTAAVRRFVVLHISDEGGGLEGHAVLGDGPGGRAQLADVSYEGDQLSWRQPLDGLDVEVTFTARIKGDLLTGRSQTHIDATVIGTRSAAGRPPG